MTLEWFEEIRPAFNALIEPPANRKVFSMARLLQARPRMFFKEEDLR